MQDLQRLPVVLGQPAEEQAVAVRVSAELNKWSALPVLPASAWKALVLELKVRLSKSTEPP